MREKEKTPVGVLMGSFEELHAAGCIQTCCDIEADLLTAQILYESRLMAMRAIQPNLCNGCPVFSRECRAYQLYHTEPKEAQQEKADRVAASQVKLHETCRICGYKIGGENHNEGDHHKRALRGGQR